MTRLLHALVAALVLAGVSSPSLATTSSAPVPSMEDLLTYSRKTPTVDEARIEALKSTGLRIGAQAGLAHRARAIVAEIEENAALLDRIFAFQPLLSAEGLLPPVIVEYDQKMEIKNNAQRLEFAGKTYKIVAPARFVRVAPTWRDYLFLGLLPDQLKVDDLPESLRPANSEEEKIWQDSVRSGWAIGEQQADAIFAENVARLRRDYLGMLKYRYLLRQGMIKAPVLAKSRPRIKVTDDQIVIGEGAMEVQQRARMESDWNAWGVEP